MQRVAALLILVVFLFFGGCSLSAPLQDYPTQHISQTTTATTNTGLFVEPDDIVVHSTSTQTPPSISPIPSDTSVFPSNNGLRYAPFEVSSTLPDNGKPKEALVIVGDNPFIMNFNQADQKVVLPESYCLSTSPDGRWLVYCPLSPDSPTGRWLVVESYDQKRQKMIPMDSNLLFIGSHLWLDSQNLIFPLMPKENPVRPYSMVVINPFIEEQTELPSDYPGMKLLYIGPYPMQFGYSDVVYDPTLNLVVYPEWGAQSYYVLWDRKKETVLAKVLDQGIMSSYPLWSPDGSQVSIAVKYEEGNRQEKNIEEWFSVSREGQVEQLTHFGNYFERAEIGEANWSPDGKEIAFWLETNSGLCPSSSLAILNLPLGQVTNTCVPGSIYNDAPPPVWSSDSQFIAVKNDDENITRIIIIDIRRGRAFHLQEAGPGQPMGWLLVEQ